MERGLSVAHPAKDFCHGGSLVLARLRLVGKWDR